jgi:hypothetical protein
MREPLVASNKLASSGHQGLLIGPDSYYRDIPHRNDLSSLNSMGDCEVCVSLRASAANLPKSVAVEITASVVSELK